MGDASYITHAVMMVTHALAVTSLPVRIARSEVRRALFNPPIQASVCPYLGPYYMCPYLCRLTGAPGQGPMCM